MKVSGPRSGGPVGGPGASKRGDGGGFSPTGVDAAREAAPAAMTAAASGVSSLDALLALQEAGGPLERRKRAVLRAGRVLDMLDAVKLALLDGEVSGAALERLRGSVGEARAATDDPRLEGVLDEIETRAAVELAKQEMARAAA
ncbi:MAG TPA: flagellar assembly protein FliX [Caulobacteraceae bacterium]|jgi:hypothetical protein|nr:flagellar assembly protein FliX [Caulobacteraceae bacterium]